MGKSKKLSMSQIGTLYLNDVGLEISLVHGGLLAAQHYIKFMPTADSCIESWKSNVEQSIKLDRESGVGPLSVLRWSKSEASTKKRL